MDHHDDPLAGFGPATRAWFGDSFTSPTVAQTQAWQSIRSSAHTLLVAPTGSGKTLAAFLHCLDQLSSPRPSDQKQTSVLYVSPLKALAVDVERNLTAPLRGIELAAQRLGLPRPNITVGLRTGDTPAAERRRLQAHPPDIVITTPESLFLMLSSQVGSTLAGVTTVIIDEVHALAGTKRGVHLALSLERLSAMTATDPQRIGLSATVRPAERVAAFLAGDRPVQVVSPASDKSWDLSIQVPIPDLTQLALPADPETGVAPANQSIWPHLVPRILDLVVAHRSTLCFVNSRRVAERLTAQLNEAWQKRCTSADGDAVSPAATTAIPAAIMGQAGIAAGVEAEPIARAHHGSVSKERRAQIEADLKSGRLPCVVATSSLELGIDMGAVDQVIQVSSPPSVASGLQRVGRAGHQVGATSRGVVLPTHRADVLESAVVVQRMVTGAIEEVARLTNPLDVLAQQLVSMTVDHSPTSEECFQLIKRCDAYRDLPRSIFDATVDMLTGRYPSEEWAELRPRMIWDRSTDLLQARPGSRRLVTTSGGTIPDRGLFGVFLMGEPGTPGRRVGELDEEMVHESRVGDVFTLGTSSWRIHEITPHQVLVSPAPGQPGRLPFWHGDAMSRPAELGRAIGELTHQLSAAEEGVRLQQLRELGLDDHAATNLSRYLSEQLAATGVVPDATTIVVERFRDQLGDWQLCLHSPLGRAILHPWALAIEYLAKARYGVDARAMATNDGIIVRLPDVDSAPPGLDLLDLDPGQVEDIITDQVQGSALFAARFRECAARALLLPRLDPTRRTPLWQQRMRSAQLLQVASGHADFPIVLETLRECLEDVFDLPGLLHLLHDIGARRVRVVEVETQQPSPFARSLLFANVGEFLYDGDQPLAERRLAALSLDQRLLAELLGRDSGDELFDDEAIRQVGEDLMRRGDHSRATTAEALWDVLRTTGPLSADELAAAGAEPEWLAALEAERRITTVTIAAQQRWCVIDDLGLLRDGLGIPVPPGWSAPEPVAAEQALQRLILRWLRTHVAVTVEELSARWGVAETTVVGCLSELKSRHDLSEISGRWWHASVLAAVRRRTLALLRRSVEAVDPHTYARFLAGWQELDSPASGLEGLLMAVETVAGHPIPASMLEPFVVGPRVVGPVGRLLDEAIASGEVIITGHDPLPGGDGWIQLWPRGFVLSQLSTATLSDRAAELLHQCGTAGAWTLEELVDDTVMPADVDALWELFWAGRITCDSFAPLREASKAGAVKSAPKPVAGRRSRLSGLRAPRLAGPGGRWRVVHPRPRDETAHLAAATLLAGRTGVVTRGSVQIDPLFGSFSDAYSVLSAMEASGAVRRGWFIEGLGAAQFALPGAVDRLREATPDQARLLAACDPANPYGAALPWPEADRHRPSRRAGALVVLDDGLPICFLERGVRTLLTFVGLDDPRLGVALALVAGAVHDGRLKAVTVSKVDGRDVLGYQDCHRLLEAAGFRMTPQGFRLRN